MNRYFHTQCLHTKTNRITVRLLVGGLTHMGQNVGQFLTLPLGADVRTEATLQELEGALILGHLQQLHTALLVRRVANDLADQIAHELGVLGLDLEKKRMKRAISNGFHNGSFQRENGCV